MSRLVDELNRENLCTHFILPLIKLNRFSFVLSNFINSWLVKPYRDHIAVAVSSIELVSVDVSMRAEVITGKDCTWLLYSIPQKWIDDVDLFTKGQFSEMSDEAKTRIREFSGLDYRKTEGRRIVTDYRLHALNKAEILKQKWEEIIVVDDLGDMELLSIPKESSYITKDQLV